MFRISLIIFLIITYNFSAFAAEGLQYDPTKYDLEKGCFDPNLNAFRRIKLATAAEIQERIVSKDFECTEMSDVVIDPVSEGGQALLVHGDFEKLKVVGIEGTGGSLGSAGVFDFNFRGAKVTNLFLDYQVAIGGDATGILATGIYLGFYAAFSTVSSSKNCTNKMIWEVQFPLPSYVIRTDAALGIRLKSALNNEEEFRDFGTAVSICAPN